MANTRIKRISIHVAFWILYVIYETTNAGWAQQDYFDFSQIHKVWTTIPLIIGIVYLNLYVLMPKYLYSKRYWLYALSLVVTVIVWALFTRFIAYQFWLEWDKENAYYQYLSAPKEYFVATRIARNAFRLYPIVALTMLIKVLRNSYNKEKQLRIAELEKHKVHLSYLRAQIHPHFFFNTLSSLYSLTLKKSDKAPDVVMRMSGLMHYMLYETGTEPVLLEDELNQLKNYIAIEELRFGERIEYSFQISGSVEGKIISPLLLLPFVENAFKHSFSHELNKAWVTIHTKVSEHLLYFIVENSVSMPNQSSSNQGIGLANVRQRLLLSYPNRYELKIKEEDNIFTVNLKLQLDEKD